MNKTPLITLSHINVRYAQRRVLTDVNLTIYAHDFIGVIGPNGGGKTTLIKTILGLKKPESGTITYYNSQGAPTRSLRMGYLPQYNKIDKNFPISVYEVVLSGIRKRLWSRYTEAQHHQVRQMLDHMGLSPYAQRPIGTLSGGQVQRALLARAIISQPDLVILDEPNTYIDKLFQSQLYELLEQINRQSAIVLVSHDLGSVLQNVRTIACVNETLDYHPDTELPEGWIEEHFGCPIDLIAHGHHPHRVLKQHSHEP